MVRCVLPASVLVTLCVAGPAFAQHAPAVSDQAAREAAETAARRFSHYDISKL